MNLDLIPQDFDNISNKYAKLGQNIVQALELFLAENEISYLAIYFRIKDKESFIEKLKRKSYSKPFDDIEDICGVRIICYYQSDIQKIRDIINNEFIILESQDKEDLLNHDQFGYRSTHFIAKIKSKWLQAPNYRGLENLKTEIQIRTVLMHSWAEIAHKLSYKKDKDIPEKFKRKLHRISATLEEADLQFEELKDGIISYREDIKKILNGQSKYFIDEVELNLDSLQLFLDLNFSDRNRDIKRTSQLVDEFTKNNISLGMLITSYEKVKNHLHQIEETTLKNGRLNGTLNQVDIAKYIMNLTNENYRKTKDLPLFVLKSIDYWKKELKLK